MRKAWLLLLSGVRADYNAVSQNAGAYTVTELAHPFENFGSELEISAAAMPITTGATPTESSLTQPTAVSIETRSGKKEIPVTDNFFTSFMTAFGMIIFSELGDKTFLIAAILAMRNSRTKVFLATSAALTLMTVISVLAGRVIPMLISQTWTKWIAAVLFLVFGVMMVKEGFHMADDHLREEYDEVVHEIEGGRTQSVDAIEAQATPAMTTSERLTSQLDELLGGTFSPIALQAFSMVFLAEWGDRSQLATIVLAAAQNPWGVAIGASIGHALCSLIAVWLGRALASFLSIKTVTISGGFLFIFFAFFTVL